MGFVGEKGWTRIWTRNRRFSESQLEQSSTNALSADSGRRSTGEIEDLKLAGRGRRAGARLIVGTKDVFSSPAAPGLKHVFHGRR